MAEVFFLSWWWSPCFCSLTTKSYHGESSLILAVWTCSPLGKNAEAKYWPPAQTRNMFLDLKSAWNLAKQDRILRLTATRETSSSTLPDPEWPDLCTDLTLKNCAIFMGWTETCERAPFLPTLRIGGRWWSGWGWRWRRRGSETTRCSCWSTPPSGSCCPPALGRWSAKCTYYKTKPC